MEKLRQSIELRIKELYSRRDLIDQKMNNADGLLFFDLVDEQRVVLARIDELQSVMFNITCYA